jgi:hypothetical protein
MINATDNYAAWALFVDQMDEARDHLQELANTLHSAGRMDEPELTVHLGHIYAHLNRAWHSRNLPDGIKDEEWSQLSKFPADLEPVG